MKRLRGYFLVICALVFWNTGMLLDVDAEGQPENTVTIVAHRAGASIAPENTLAALEQAIRDGAPIAEIDVQQLADGTLIVMHDSNFLRTAGVDRNVWEVDHEEVAGYEVGTAFSDSYLGEGIATLEQFLQCADGRISLMIELKYTGHEVGLEAAVVELLHRYQMDRTCIVGSMNASILERVKQLDAGIPTVFIAHDLTEEQYRMDCADSYSIEAVNLSKDMVDRIHEQNKPIYGWTANRWRVMQMIVDSGADGIVTDNVFETQMFLRNSSNRFSLKNYLLSGKKMV